MADGTVSITMARAGQTPHNLTLLQEFRPNVCFVSFCRPSNMVTYSDNITQSCIQFLNTSNNVSPDGVTHATCQKHSLRKVKIASTDDAAHVLVLKVKLLPRNTGMVRVPGAGPR